MSSKRQQQAEVIIGRRLQEFTTRNRVAGKGALCVMLCITRAASRQKPPYDSNSFLTDKGGQVAGLGRTAVQSILADHGIERTLAEEGGRTSRGSIQRMRDYVVFLNVLFDEDCLDLSFIENWWVARVNEYFATDPFRLKNDPSKSLRYTVGELIAAAFARQKESPGMMVAGAVMEHLVGAKLETALPDVEVSHKGFSVADASSGRKADFIVADAAIHVTTAPTEALLRKCCENLEENLRPVIITTETGVGGAEALASNVGVNDRVDIFEIKQFVATNVYGWSQFAHAKRPVAIGEFIQKYNRIAEDCETDPSLKISLAK